MVRECAIETPPMGPILGVDAAIETQNLHLCAEIAQTCVQTSTLLSPIVSPKTASDSMAVLETVSLIFCPVLLKLLTYY